MSVEYFSPFLLSSVNIRPDKYIRDMIKDSKGYIWSGGYYNLKCIDPRKNTVRLYPGVNTVTAIEEKDTNFMWVGTATGLFLLNRNSGEYQYILMPVESTYINTLYQANDGLLYIGTNGSGVLIYDPGNMSFEHILRVIRHLYLTVLYDSSGNERTDNDEYGKWNYQLFYRKEIIS